MLISISSKVSIIYPWLQQEEDQRDNDSIRTNAFHNKVSCFH
jgi:hypothetical protein